LLKILTVKPHNPHPHFLDGVHTSFPSSWHWLMIIDQLFFYYEPSKDVCHKIVFFNISFHHLLILNYHEKMG